MTHLLFLPGSIYLLTIYIAYADYMQKGVFVLYLTSISVNEGGFVDVSLVTDSDLNSRSDYIPDFRLFAK
jgi:hypothetical protein